ncbi:MAG: class I SAM-dependent methyltransferase [Alphaproteobacteria bacterium]|nr:class I SAM-dependent methyltransferase [Alphaproteobacteria bacterium]
MGLRSIAHESVWRVRRALRRPVTGRFHPYSYTRPDRYPWLFSFAAGALTDGERLRLLSFGCSRGDEVASLRRYFPLAHIKGLDISRRNIAACRRLDLDNVEFGVASSTEAEPSDAYDAVFCLCVLCHGDLRQNERPPLNCAPLIEFDAFERAVNGLSRCLKRGGLLFLFGSNFRFADTSAASAFKVVLNTNMPDGAPLYDRHNRLVTGSRYFEVGFRKHSGQVASSGLPG